MTYDDRSLKETTQDADAKLRTANALNLAQLGLQGAQVRLQADALSEQRETNRRLEELGVTQAQLVELDRSIDANIREGSRTLGELKGAADRMSGLLSEQNGLLAGIGGDLHIMSYQTFAMWRQTDEGRHYLEWAKQARETVNLILNRTRRMEGARELDVKANAHRLLADRLEKRGDPPVEPAKPVLPKPPQMPSVPVKPVDEVAGRRFTLTVVATIAGALYGGVSAFISGLNHNIFFALFNIPIPAIIFGILGFVAGTVLGLIVFHKTGRMRDNEKRYESRMEEYVEAKKRYDDYQRHAKKVNDLYMLEYERWRIAMEEWECSDVSGVSREARALTVQPTRWAASNPMDVVRTLTGIMENAPRLLPAPESLPDPVPPILAASESIPDTAPRMRAELEAMRLEEETFGSGAKESAKPDPWAVQD